MREPFGILWEPSGRRRPVLTLHASDGTRVRAYDDGAGPLIVLLGPGLDHGTRTTRPALGAGVGRGDPARPSRPQHRLG